MNEYARVEDDEMVTSQVAEERRWGNGVNGNVKFDKSKKKRKEDFSKVNEDGYRGVTR